jgi:hypothetical protein
LDRVATDQLAMGRFCSLLHADPLRRLPNSPITLISARSAGFTATKLNIIFSGYQQCNILFIGMIGIDFIIIEVTCWYQPCKLVFRDHLCLTSIVGP